MVISLIVVITFCFLSCMFFHFVHSLCLMSFHVHAFSVVFFTFIIYWIITNYSIPTLFMHRHFVLFSSFDINSCSIILCHCSPFPFMFLQFLAFSCNAILFHSASCVWIHVHQLCFMFICFLSFPSVLFHCSCVSLLYIHVLSSWPLSQAATYEETLQHSHSLPQMIWSDASGLDVRSWNVQKYSCWFQSFRNMFAVRNSCT